MSKRGINRVIILGNLGKDPEIKMTAGGDQIANFSVATSETWKDKQTGEQKEETTWHRCTAFGALAKIIGEYLHKGSKVYIEGSLRTRSYQKEGQTHYVTEIWCDEMQMLGGTRDGDERQEKHESKPAKNQNSFDSGFDEFSDIPF